MPAKVAFPVDKLPGGRTFKFFRDEIFDEVRSHPVIADPASGEGLVPVARGGGQH